MIGFLYRKKDYRALSVYALVLTIVLFGSFVVAPKSVLALAKCSDAADKDKFSTLCISIGQCNQLININPKISSISTDDCSAKDSNICCITPKAPQAPQKPVCSAQGGSCYFSSDGNCNAGLKSIGQYDCASSETCCVQAPAGCTDSNGH